MTALHYIITIRFRGRFTARLVLAAVLIALLAACTASAPAAPPPAAPPPAEPAVALEEVAGGAEEATGPVANRTEGCVEEFQPGMDYFPERIQVEYAEGFQVEYFDHYKVVSVLQPWQGAETTFQYVLVQCGTPEPEGYEDAVVIPVPAGQIVAMSTTYLANLDALGLVDHLVGMDEYKYTNTPSVLERIEAGEIVEIGGLANVNVELVLDLTPDFVMAHGIGLADYDIHPKLMEAGVKVVLNGDYTEPVPLGRSEWVKFVALFFNREAAAEAVFAQISQEYQEIAGLANSVEEKPTVLLGSLYEGTWWVSGGQSYTAKLLADAGGDYLWAEDESIASVPSDFETVFDRGADADFWLNPDNVQWMNIDDVLASDERYGGFAALQNGHLYNNSARVNQHGGNDFYESGIANPHLILKDMVKILHPELLPDHELIYYRQIR